MRLGSTAARLGPSEGSNWELLFPGLFVAKGSYAGRLGVRVDQSSPGSPLPGATLITHCIRLPHVPGEREDQTRVHVRSERRGKIVCETSALRSYKPLLVHRVTMSAVAAETSPPSSSPPNAALAMCMQSTSRLISKVCPRTPVFIRSHHTYLSRTAMLYWYARRTQRT